MAEPWELDELVEPAAPVVAPRRPVSALPAAEAMPWEADEIVSGPITDLPPVQAAPPDFSGVTSTVSSTASPPAPESRLRGLGLSARATLQAAGGLLGAFGGDAINALTVNPISEALGFAPAMPYREAAGSIADALGLPSPNTSGERVAGDVAEALTGTGLTLGVGGALNAGRSALTAPSIRTAIADFFTAQPALQTVSAATGAGASGAVREGGGGTGAQLAAALAGGLAPGAVSAGVPAAFRGAFRGGEQGRASLSQAIDDFASLGATPSIGQGTGSWARQGAESLLAGGPTSGGVMRRFAEGQNEAIGEGLTNVSNSLARNMSGERAGRAIERGVDTFAKNTSAMRKALYWQADQYIPGDTAVSLSNTQRALVDLTTPVAGAEATTGAMISPKIQQLAQNVADDVAAAQAGGAQGIPYEAVKQVRSKIGEELSDFSLSNDRPTAQLKQLYAALSSDLEAAAQAAGPAAVRAVKRANNYFRASAERLETLERVVDKSGGPEKIFQAAMNGTKDGATTLRAVMRSLPEDGQKALSAAVIKRMGLATPGNQNAVGDVFSPNTLLTNWGKLSPEARRELFGRFGSDFSANMDKVARVADRIKAGSEVFKNPSGTANRGAALAYGASIATAIMSGSPGVVGGLLATGAGSNLVARLMTNPHWVRWLAKSTELPVGVLPAQINVLKRIATENDEPDIAEAADLLSQGAPQGNDRPNDGGG